MKERTNRPVYIRISEQTYSDVVRIAERLELSASDVMREAIKQYIDADLASRVTK